jgi:hypothetical protein
MGGSDVRWTLGAIEGRSLIDPFLLTYRMTLIAKIAIAGREP